MKQNILKHNKLLLILCGLLVGIIFLLYDITLFYSLGTKYHPFLYRNMSDFISYQAHYAMYLNEALEGKLYPSDSVIYENQKKIVNFAVFKSFLIGKLARILNISVVNSYLFTKLIFGILLFLTCYYLLFYLTNFQLIAFIGSFFMTLGLDLLWDRKALIPEIIQYIFQELPAKTVVELSVFAMTMLPLTIFLFTLLVSFKYLNKEKESKWDFILPSLLLAGTGYIEFHFVAELILFYFILFIFFILKKDKKRLMKIIRIALLSGILLVPYIYLYVIKITGANGIEYMKRGSIAFTREPDINLLHLLIIIFLIAGYRKKDDIYYLLLFLILAPLIGMNAQILLGHDLKSYHWFERIVRPLGIIIGFTVISRWIPKLYLQKLSSIILSIFIVSVLILNAGFKQISYASTMRPYFQEMHETIFPQLNLLNNNTEEDSVVLAGPEISSLIPMYTKNYMYLAPGYSFSSDDEIIDRLLIFFRILETSDKQIITFLKNRENQLYLFNAKYRATILSKTNDIPTDDIKNILKRYQLMKNADLKTLLARYRLDYIIFSPFEKKIANIYPDKYPYFIKVYQINKTQIYKIDWSKI